MNITQFKNIKIRVDKNLVLIVVAISAVWFTAAMIAYDMKPPSKLRAEKIAKNSVDYLNKNILSQQNQTAELTGFSEESGIIKISININGNSYNSYATKDGKLLFPDALNLDGKIAQVSENSGQSNNNSNQPAKQTVDNLKKADKPLLEAYVVSECPFGLQMQRAMAEAIKNVPSLADFVKVRYIGEITGNKITAMHGEQEAQENLRQICIREEQTDKYWGYVSCHIQDGNIDNCLAGAGINQNKLNSCMRDGGSGIAYAKKDFDLNLKYDITGSPTLILNNQPVSEFDFGGRSAETIKTLVCESSLKKPDFCSGQLNVEQAETSFSLTYAGNGNLAPAGNNPSCAQ